MKRLLIISVLVGGFFQQTFASCNRPGEEKGDTDTTRQLRLEVPLSDEEQQEPNTLLTEAGSFEGCPPEVIFHVVYFLDAESLWNVKILNTFFQEICQGFYNGIPFLRLSLPNCLYKNYACQRYLIEAPYSECSTCALRRKALPSLPSNLKELTLKYTFITDEALSGRLPPSLTSLNLKATNITDKALQKNLPPSLEVLKLSRCFYLTGEGLKNLPPTLKELCLSQCEFTEVRSLPQSLTYLDLSYCANLQNVGQLPSTLKELTLEGCSLQARHFSFPSNLTSLNLSHIDNDNEDLKNLPDSLTALNLYNTSIGDGALEILPSGLRFLNLGVTLITDVVVAPESLLSSLTELTLEGCELSSPRCVEILTKEWGIRVIE